MKYFPIFFLLTFITVYADEAPIVNLHTNFGLIVLKLNPDKAPKAVENFLKYANNNFYDDTIFHRVIKNYIIQAGGYNKDYQKKTSLYEPIVNESDNYLENGYGTIAMARNYRDPDSATSQFFINLKDNISLDYNEIMEEMGYTVFGKVIEGMDVVEKIGSLATGVKGTLKKNVPQTPVIIELVMIKTIIGTTELPTIVESDIPIGEISAELDEAADDELSTTIRVNEINTNISDLDRTKSPIDIVIDDEIFNTESSNKSSIDDAKIVEPEILPKLAILNVQIPTPELISEKISIVGPIQEQIPKESKAVSLLAPDLPSRPDIPDPVPY